MPLKHCNTNKAQPLKAWEAVSPHEGVKTRRRTSTMKSGSPPIRSLSPEEQSSTKENDMAGVQHDPPEQENAVIVSITALGKRKERADGSVANEPLTKVYVTPKRQRPVIGRAFTKCEQNAQVVATVTPPCQGSTGKFPAGNDFEIHEDRKELQKGGPIPRDQKESPCPGTPKHTTGQPHQKCLDHNAVLKDNYPEHVTNPHKATDAHTSNNNGNNNISALDKTPFDSNPGALGLQHTLPEADMEVDSSSDITVAAGQEAVNQLRALNSDLRAENSYYRLMAEIAMKTSSLRRGCKYGSEPLKLCADSYE
jgi:hypothetical protein